MNQIFELLTYPFFRNALLAVLFISIAAAMTGTYIITRRMVSLTGGITHACFGGLGLGYFLGVNPIIMAAVFAVGSSAGVEWLASRYRVREDSAVAVVWALGMAVGVLFVFLTPGYVPELNSFLFGNILTVTSADLWTFGGFTALLIAFFAAFHSRIIAVAFDADFAKVSGLPVKFISYVMTVMVALCVVLTIKLVGIMLLMSMLSLPQMIAETRLRRFVPMMWGSVVISVITCVAGLVMSIFVDVPCSAIIVLFQVFVFAVARALPRPRRS
ncbi:MAG: metal ABC transporter permease [Muribaculaceae bacterium]|nr:metal ABC transporter permease [Muribaculaceae bacterium]